MNTEIARKRCRRRTHRTPGSSVWYGAWYGKASAARFVVTSLLMIVLGCLSIHVVSMGLAHLEVIRVENDLKRWQQSGRVSTPQAIESALRAIDSAIRLHQDNPYQLSLKARLLEWRAYSLGRKSAVADYRAALELYRHAATLRPLWPDSRAEMINVKLNLNELDDELDDLLVQADKLGPYTPAVHTAIVRAAFAKGQNDSPLLRRHLVRGLQDHRSRNQVQELTQRFDQEAAACNWLAQAPEPKPTLKFCNHQEFSAAK